MGCARPGTSHYFRLSTTGHCISMLQKPLHRTVILSVVFSLGFSPGSQAQETETDSYSELDEVVVISDPVEGGSGPGASAGRDQLDRSDQMEMEDIFDDIDDLSTLGGDDEGNSISIGGLSHDLVKVTLDGQSFSNGRGNGGFGAGDMPPDMILRVDVHKNPAASMEEGGAGGRVNLQMRVPMDIPKPSTSINARLGYAPDEGGFSPSGSIFLGRPSESKKFGYMLSVSVTDRARETDSQGISSWNLRDFDGTSAYIPRQVRSNVEETDQGNIFTGLALGFRPRQSLDIGARIFFSEKQKDTEGHSLQHRIDKQRDIFPLAFDGRIVSALDSSDDSRRNLRVIGSTREDQTDSLILGMDVKWRHEDWRVAGAVGYNTVENNSDRPSQSIIFDTNSAFGYTADGDGSLILSYLDDFAANEDFAASRINLSTRHTKDTNSFGGIDLTRQLGEGIIRRIRFGGKIRDMTGSRQNSRGLVSLDEDLSLADYASNQGQQTRWDTIEWPTTDMEQIDSIVQDNQIDWQDNLLNEYDIEQRSSAGYLQADFRAKLAEDRILVGNVGVRIVGTETWIDGYQDLGEGPVPISLKTDYTDTLPSLSMRMRIAERASLTLGAAKVMTRPAFNSLAPGNRINFSDRTAKSGNPNLQPFRANQFLAELAWAPDGGPRLRGEIAYRDVKSYFALAEESVEINDDIFLVTRPINGDDGSILTASVKLDQKLRRLTRRLRNFAVSVSYTRNKSRTDLLDPFSGEKLPMPNTADNVIKAGVTYDTETFVGKLKYDRRGKSLKSSLSEGGLSVWNQPVDGLNLNLGWKLKENLRFSLDARNLLNEDQIQSTDDSGQLLRISERDKLLSATLRAKW
jgi:iron complex outermembrane receptor protein